MRKEFSVPMCITRLPACLILDTHSIKLERYTTTTFSVSKDPLRVLVTMFPIFKMMPTFDKETFLLYSFVYSPRSTK